LGRKGKVKLGGPTPGNQDPKKKERGNRWVKHLGVSNTKWCQEKLKGGNRAVGRRLAEQLPEMAKKEDRKGGEKKTRLQVKVHSSAKEGTRGYVTGTEK